MQNVRLNRKHVGELHLEQTTQNEASGPGQVLEVVCGVAEDIRRSAQVVAWKIGGETRPSDHAPIEALAARRAVRESIREQ